MMPVGPVGARVARVQGAVGRCARKSARVHGSGRFHGLRATGGARLASRRIVAIQVFCCFSHFTGDGLRQDPHYGVGQFVNALKGRPLSGYAYLRVARDEPRRRLDGGNAALAFEWFGEMAAGWVAALGSPIALVPIPDSRCIDSEHSARTRPLADALAARIPGAVVLDVLRFDRQMHSAHAAQGARDARSLCLHLRVSAPLTPNPRALLVDDIITTGGHVAASAAVLRAAGAQVLGAVCGASADRVPVVDPFERVIRTVEEYHVSPSVGSATGVALGTPLMD